jgi:glucosylglycerate synthase
MATADSISELSSSSPPPAVDLLVLVPALPPENFEVLLTNLAAVFPAEGMLIATPSPMPAQTHQGLRMVATPPANSGWSLHAAGFLQAWQLAQEHSARAILILGPGSESLRPGGLQLLATSVLAGSVDLAMPHYTVPAHTGMINSAIVYPLTRALFASRVRFPLAIDLGLSPRMAQRLAGGAQRFAQPDQPESLLWPVNEAAVAGFAVDDFDVGARTLPQPAEADINSILARVTGSVFADIEQKAVYWQRARRAPLPRRNGGETSAPNGASEVPRMVEAFRLAYNNLLEIWSLVLPPHSLLGLKRLSQMSAEQFRMPDGLWARIVYDFLIAYRQRTMNRGHLLGALIPLYMGWVAGHMNLTNAGTSAEMHIEAVAAAFEEDKPYVVSRWRWPDRFNA